jgi:hypothetical protein
MNGVRQLIREIHRRSIWQVLSVYVVGSWGAFQVVETVTEIGGLPDWVPSFAVILLVIGLPIVLATAVVQEGVKGPEEGRNASQGDFGSKTPTDGPAGKAQVEGGGSGGPRGQAANRSKGRKRSLVFTWRNAVAGGIASFALLGILVAGYFVMWSKGIGPVGSLAAQGVFEEGDAVVLAEFENTSDDETLGGMVTEALRVDPEAGHRQLLDLVAREVGQEPEKARLLTRICLAVSEQESGVPPAERREIARLCGFIGLDPAVCGLGAEGAS